MVGDGYDDFEGETSRRGGNPSGNPDGFEEFVDEARDRIHFLARTDPRRQERDFQVRVKVPGERQFLTTYELWQDTGDRLTRIIPVEGVTDTITDREVFLEEIEETTRMLRESNDNPGGNPHGNPHPDVDPDLTPKDLDLRPFSIRNFEPEEFIVAAQNGGKAAARKSLRRVESGRFEPMLAEGHKFFRALDPDERRDFAEANPGLMKWLGVWGFLEDLITFPKHSGIDQELFKEDRGPR